MSTRADVCEQLKSVLDSLSPGEATEVALEEGRAGLDGWGDFFSYCRKEHKNTVKTEFDEGSWSCTVLKKADASTPAPTPAPEPVADPEETQETSVVDVEVEKEPEPEPEPEPKSFFWGKKEDSE
jgi:hypothetical protein